MFFVTANEQKNVFTVRRNNNMIRNNGTDLERNGVTAPVSTKVCHFNFKAPLDRVTQFPYEKKILKIKSLKARKIFALKKL